MPNDAAAAAASLPLLVAAWAERDPDRKVLTFEDQGREETRTYRTLWDNARRLALTLTEYGVSAGDRFAVLLQNHPEFVEAMVAAGIVGAAIVPIDPRTRGEKLAFMLRQAGCKGAMVGSYSLPSVLEQKHALSNLSWIGVVEDVPGAGLAVPGLEVFTMAQVARQPVRDLPIHAIHEPDLMQIMYTSGTTGDPKGVMITHGRFMGAARGGAPLFGYRADERPYTGLSLTHGNAQFVTLAPTLYMGLSALFSRKFTKSRLWDLIRRHRATTFSLLGGMSTAIYSEAPKPDDADNPVRFVVSAGMPAAIWEDFARRYDIEILEFYGAMEGGMTIKPIGQGPIGSCGRVVSGQVARVVDEDARDVSPGTPGELWFRPADGTPATVAYFDNPAAAAAKVADGWLHTGDVVTMDEEGWVFFLYRKGGGIRRNGDFINPAFLEKTVAEHPDVIDVSVFGVPAASAAPGEMDVVAAVVVRDPGRVDPSSIFGWCSGRVEANMVPSYLMVMPELPKTASEKVQPARLAELFGTRAYPVYLP